LVSGTAADQRVQDIDALIVSIHGNKYVALVRPNGVLNVPALSFSLHLKAVLGLNGLSDHVEEAKRIELILLQRVSNVDSLLLPSC
jgi:hypothetical protein